jgi:hypothetical protein
VSRSHDLDVIFTVHDCRKVGVQLMCLDTNALVTLRERITGRRLSDSDYRQ